MASPAPALLTCDPEVLTSWPLVPQLSRLTVPEALAVGTVLSSDSHRSDPFSQFHSNSPLNLGLAKAGGFLSEDLKK